MAHNEIFTADSVQFSHAGRNGGMDRGSAAQRSAVLGWLVGAWQRRPVG